MVCRALVACRAPIFLSHFVWVFVRTQSLGFSIIDWVLDLSYLVFAVFGSIFVLFAVYFIGFSRLLLIYRWWLLSGFFVFLEDLEPSLLGILSKPFSFCKFLINILRWLTAFIFSSFFFLLDFWRVPIWRKTTGLLGAYWIYSEDLWFLIAINMLSAFCLKRHDFF